MGKSCRFWSIRLISWGSYEYDRRVNGLRFDSAPNVVKNIWWYCDLEATFTIDSRWHHVAATYDGKTRRIFIDGSLMASDVPKYPLIVDHSNNVNIGRTIGMTGSKFLKGFIDEVMVYKRALNQSEILSMIDNSVCSNHGICVQNDRCICDFNWYGQECNIPSCFGILANVSSVCSGKGTCVSPNNCTCVPGYVGNRCELINCFGKNSNDPKVCNMRGTCIAPDVCKCDRQYTGEQCEQKICSPGYTGLNCELPICYDRNSSDPHVCSRNGNCTAPNTCTCKPTYYGSNCENSIIDCFGVQATDPSVCRGRGTCIAKDTCRCNYGYSGLTCNILSCFNKTTQTPNLICSGNGICQQPDVCQCNYGYTGEECQFFQCGNLSSNDPNVCRGNGFCTGPQKCSCNSGFTGINCEIPICYGKNASDPKVCSGNGICQQDHTCSCHKGYDGKECEIPQCFGIAATSPLVCSGKGICVAANNCKCYEDEVKGYWSGPTCNVCRRDKKGDNCLENFCDPISTCNSSGICNDLECQCFKNSTFGYFIEPFCDKCFQDYYGTNCKIFCHPTLNCTGHGVCNSTDGTCICDNDNIKGRWTGERCDSCQEGWTGPNCKCHPVEICNNNGICNGDSCKCHADTINGFWDGENCEICKQDYFIKTNCTKYCNANITCSTHGKCSDLAKCECFSNEQAGFWTGDNCNQCVEGYFGSKCLISASNFTIIETGDGMIATLTLNENVTSIDCSNVFAKETLDKLGIEPICRRPPGDFKRFEVLFGTQATITPMDPIVLNLTALDHPKAYGTFSLLTEGLLIRSLLPPKTFVGLTPIIQGPTTIGDNSGIQLNAYQSTSPDRRTLSFEWIFSGVFPNTSTTDLEAFLSTQKDKNLISIPKELLKAGHTYNITLKISNYLGVSASTVHTFQKATTKIISSSINVPLVEHTTDKPLLLEGGTFDETDQKLSFKWMQISGPPLDLKNIVLNERELYLSPFFLTPGNEYSFALVVTDDESPTSSSAVVRVIVKSQSLVAIIRGGNRKVFMSDTVELDASLSYDPDRNLERKDSMIYEWSCFDKRTNDICDRLEDMFENFDGISTRQGKQIRIRKGVFIPGSYIIRLTYSDGQRSSNAEVQIDVVSNPVPKVSLEPLPQRISVNQKITLRGSVQSIVSKENLIFSWKVVKGNLALDSSTLLSPTNQEVLVIKPNVLLYGQQYIFRLEVTDKISSVTGFAETETYTLTPPLPGLVLVEPMIVQTLQIVTVTCLQWRGEATPLRYYFEFIQPLDDKRVTLSEMSLSNSISVTLPVGDPNKNYTLTLVANVVDQYGAIGSVQKNIQVFPLQAKSEAEKVQQLKTLVDDKLEKLARDDKSQEVIQNIIAISEALVVHPSSQNGTGNPCEYNGLICSGRGTCIQEKCKCINETFVGDFCEQTKEELEQIINLKSKLIEVLADQAMDRKRPMTEEVINQNSYILSSLTSNSKQLPIESVSTSANLLKNILNTTSSSGVSDTTAEYIGDSLSNIAKIAFVPHVKSNSSDTPAVNKELSQQVYHGVELLSKNILQRISVGEEPKVIMKDELQIQVQKEFTDKLKGKSNKLSTGEDGTFSKVNLPNDFVVDADEVNLKLTNWINNPFAYSEKTQNISSIVVSFSLSTGQGELNVTHLPTPIEITIPGKFNLSQIGNYSDDGYYNVSCNFWSPNEEELKTTGCFVYNITETSITCMCDHLTDFMATLEYIAPDINIITPEDIIKFGQSPITIAMMSTVLIMYFILLVVFYLLDRVIDAYYKRKKEVKIKDVNVELDESSRVWRFTKEILRTIGRRHLWFSLAFVPEDEKNFTRPQRLTIIFCIIMGSLSSNALFFGRSNTRTINKVSAAIMSNLMVMPFSIVLASLFKFTEPYKKKLSNPEILQKSLESIEEHNDESDGDEFDLVGSIDLSDEEDDKIKEKDSKEEKIVLEIEIPPKNIPEDKPSEDNLPKEEKLDESNVKEESKEERIVLETNENEKVEKDDIKITMPSVTKDDLLKIDNLDFLDKKERKRKLREMRKSMKIEKLRENIEKRKTLREALKKDSQNSTPEENDQVTKRKTIVAKATMKIDDMADKAELFFVSMDSEKYRPYVIGGFVFISLFIFGIAALFISLWETQFGFLLEFDDKYDWTRMISWIVGIFSVIGYGAFILYVWYTARLQKYNDGLISWRWNWKHLVIPSILGIIAILIAIAITIAFWSIENPIDKPVWPVETYLVQLAGCLAVFILCIAYIILLIKKPKNKVHESIAPKRKPLPWWTILIAYPSSWLFLAGASWLLAVFGQKFAENGVELEWTSSVVLSLTLDILIKRPITICIKLVIMKLALSTIKFLFVY